MIRFAPLDASNGKAWDDFVATRADASFFHQAAWPALIANNFGHRDHSVLALQDGAVVGILPLTQMRTLLFGHSLVSLPFCVYAGPLAVDVEAGRALLAHAAGLLTSSGAACLELRGLNGLPDDWLNEPTAWPVHNDLYVTFRKSIDANDDVNLKAIPRKQRAVVRKGIERGLTSIIGSEVDTLHRIYSESVRNLGTPVFSRRWFQALATTFGNACNVVTIADGGVPMSAVMNFYWRDEVLPYYGGGTAAARACYANDFMYWQVIRHAAKRGVRLFDFGRSKHGTGAFSFKKNWGFQPTPLAYRFRLRPNATIPEHNPLNPKYRLMIAAWKRLPLPVAAVIGPRLVRGLG